MKNILEEFANDNLHPNSRGYKSHSRYGQAARLSDEAENALRDALGEPEQKLLDAYSKAQGELDLLAHADNFIYGYRLGVLMTMEVFHTSDDFVTGGE